MIIKSSFLKKVLDLLNCSINCDLEIYVRDDQLHIGTNYDDKFYIKYNTEWEYEQCEIIMNYEALQKLHQLVTLWPKSTLQITCEGEHQIIEVIEYGDIIRENVVQVDCVFEEKKNYVLSPPEVEPNITVNSKNLRQMLEFCQVQKNDILLNIDKDSLVIKNETKTIGTKVKCDEVFSDSKYTMKLSESAYQLIISFLKKVGIKSPNVYMMFLKREYAFSIKLNLSDNETVQIYTIHD